MNKLCTLFTGIVLVLSPGFIKAQSVVNYTFSQSAGAYTPITGGTVLATGSFDETNYNNQPIGFTFWYNGIAYTSFSVNANGFLAMGSTVVNSWTSISTGTSNQVISAYNYDLIGIATSGELRYQTIGVTPNRTLVVQWSNMMSWGGAGEFSFQIRLNEADFSIDVVYSNFVAEGTLRNAQVGLRGASNAQFNNRQVTNGTHTWATSVAGTLNTATCQVITGLFPSIGQTYRWVSAPPAAPTALSFSSVAATGMTLNWVDNSINESSFLVFVSTDAVNYSQAGTVASTSTATTGTPYNFVATGLHPSTLYYWQVVAMSEIPSAPISGTQSTLPGVLCGTYTIGPTGTYTSLTSAFADLALNSISCPVIFELQAAYSSTVETFPLNVPFFGGSAVNTVTVRPELAATGLSITSNDVTATVVMNGTSQITFDGRPGGTGISRELTISNINPTGSAVLYQNNTQNTGMTFLNIQGVNTSTTSGVIRFGNALSTGGGNSNNSITFSDLFAGASNPTNMIFSNNITAGTFNQNNTISNNTIRDYFSATLASNAVLLTVGNNAWTISNNSFYQTATRVYTVANIHNIISIVNTGSNYTVTGNFLGGTAPNCGGTPYVMGGTIATRLNAINVSATGTVMSNITNNTIRNFTLNTSSGVATANGIWCGINLIGANATANVTSNTIGNTTTTGNITTTTTTSGGLTVGINCQASGIVNILNNTIGSISALGSTGTISTSVTGINISTTTGVGLRTISGNTIGSGSLVNSLSTHPSTGAGNGNLVGINVLIGGSYIITNNTISGLANLYTGTSATTITRGINVTSGANTTITGNSITVLSTNAPSAGIGVSSSLAGIMMGSPTAGNHVISQNTIGGLLNTNTGAFATSTAGIIFNGPISGLPAVISRNHIGFLGSNSTAVTAINLGILSNNGLARISNNFINLGLNPDATPRTGSQIYEGIRKNGTQSNAILYNTVAIQGAGVTAGAANTFGFNRTNSGTDTLRNNVFVNNRSNGASTGIHYSIQLNNNISLISNNNDFFGSGTGYVLGRSNLIDYATLAAWQAGVGQDALSINANPNFASMIDLHINNVLPSQLESTGSLVGGISIDFDNDVRPGPTGSVNGGAINPDMGADEFDGIPVPNGNLNLSTVSLITPTNSSCFTSGQTVTFRIRNLGLSPIDFSVNSATFTSGVTGPNPQSFTTVVLNSGTLAAGATQDITVTTGYDMSLAGNYNFTGTITVTGDVVAADNSHSALITGVGTTSVTASADVEFCSGGSSPILATGVLGSTTVTFSNPTSFFIPDNNPVGVSSPIVVPGAYSSINAGDIISVNLTITHTWNNDIDIFLRAPNGSQIEISTDNGGGFGSTGYSNVTFIMTAAQNINTNTTDLTITGSWIPEQPFSLLTGTANGTWQLIVADDAPGDVGTLQNWSLTINRPLPTYSWAPATGLSNPTIANPVASPTTTTTYVVTFADERGCTATDNVVVAVNPMPVLTTIVTNVSCAGNDGAIDLSVTSGTAPFNYNWSNGATTQDITGLSLGTYTVTVSDDKSCTATTSATVSNVSGFVVIGVVDSADCFASATGAIDITPSGGNLPYSYNWSNGATTEDISLLPAGTYTVTVTDMTTCTATGSFVVSEPTQLATSLSATHVNCFGNSTGAVNLTPSGGSIPYSYNWSNGATTEDISLLPADTYTVTVTDNKGCTVSNSVAVNQPPALVVTSITVSNVSCNGFNDGSLSPNVAGGTGAYSYNWSNGATTQNISSLAPNTYTVTVTDANACTTTASATITEPATLTHTISSTNVLCFGGNTGTGTVTPSGGTAPYSYLWSDSQTDSIAYFPIGTYTVTITDANGCTNTNSVTITQPLMLTSSITGFSNVTCNGANNGTATVVAGFGTPGYTYAWSNGGTTTNATGLGAGTFTVTVTDNNGCTATSSVSITEPPPITASGNITNEVWGNDGAVDITPGGGTAPYVFNWSNGAFTEDIANLAGGTYTVTITDNNGCSRSFTFTVVSQLGLDADVAGLGTIKFFPNPSNGQMNMSIAGFAGGTLQLDVLDMNGKVVFVKQIKNAPESFIQEMDLRTLSKGIYLIRVTSNVGVHTSRIIISRD